MLKCEICGSINKIKTKTKNNIFGKILCEKHYKQLYRHGKILNRTIYDSNKINIGDDYAELELYDKQGNIVNVSIIDLDDVFKVSKFKWGINGKSKYVRNSDKGIYLHRFILDYHGELEVDHIDRNPLNNIKSNLRITTHINNMHNISKPCDNHTGIIGVIWDKERNKWRVEIQFNSKTIHIGRFENKEDAIKSRLDAELKYFDSEFSPQRHLFEKYRVK